MDDLANVDAIGRENDWTRLRLPVSDQYTRSAWGTNGYTVIARSHFTPSCHLIIRPSEMVDRNDLFAAVSASLQLKPSSEQTYRGKFRQEIWKIVNIRPLNLLITSSDDIVSVATIYLAERNAAPGIPRYFFGIAYPCGHSSHRRRVSASSCLAIAHPGQNRAGEAEAIVPGAAAQLTYLIPSGRSVLSKDASTRSGA
jgi:hypothetical protein